MKILLSSLFAFFITISLHAQPKTYLITVETNKLFSLSEGRYFVVPSLNKDMDFSFISNRIDDFLRNEYLKDFNMKLVVKDEVVNNEQYSGYESEYIQNFEMKSINGKVITDQSYLEFTSLADGYKALKTNQPYDQESSDFDELKEMFPSADVFLDAKVSFALMEMKSEIESSKSEDNYTIIPKLSLEVIITKDGNSKKIKRSSFYKLLIKDENGILTRDTYDLEYQREIFNTVTDRLIEKLRDKKEKDIKKIDKWLSKNL